MKASALALLAAASTILGCDVEETATDDPGDFRYIALVEHWDEVVCTAGQSDRCYAHTPSADELWMPVVHECEFKNKLVSGEYLFENENWWYPCDLEGQPQTFEEFRCFTYAAGYAECFGGNDGWFTKVEPHCANTTYTQNAWGAGACDNSPGTHQFDTVKVVPRGTAWWARVKNGGDAFYAIPECQLAPHVPAVAPDAC